MDWLILAQAPPVTPNTVPTEWWVPIVSMVLVALWDWLKRRFNLVPPETPAPVELPPETKSPETNTTPAETQRKPLLQSVIGFLAALLTDGKLDWSDIPAALEFLKSLNIGGSDPLSESTRLTLIQFLAARKMKVS